MKPQWQFVPERSNRFWIVIIIWIARNMGRGFARLLMYPISAYFVIFSTDTRKESRKFLNKALGRKCRWLDVFKHYRIFAECLLDRIFIYIGKDQDLEISVKGLDVLEHHANSGQGCLMVGSHLGGFEIIRALGKTRRGYTIKALIYGQATPLITGIFKELNPNLFEDFIFMGEASSLVGIDEHTRNGGFVSILADRVFNKERRVTCSFFGEDAFFPEAPVVLSRVLNVPMVFFTCLNQGNGKYALIFENLSASSNFEKTERAICTQILMQHFASRLEHYCREAPYNWFNFYDFWDKDA